MNRQTHSHHFFPKFLTEFADQCEGFTKKRSFSRKRTARAHFADLKIEGAGRVTAAKIPFTEIPLEKFPAIYFTRLGQHPVVIRESTPMGYSIQLWDGRESLCDRSRLEKTLEPEGFFLSEKKSRSGGNLHKLTSALAEEKRHIGLGLANGAVTCSLLVVFVYLLHFIFDSAFPATGMSSAGFAGAGLLTALLSCLGFFQARSLISTCFEKLSATARSREIQMPPPFPVRTLANVSSGRILTEAVAAPFFLSAAAIVIGYDAGSIAAWVTLVGCSVPAFAFLSQLPGLMDKWNQALWFFETKKPLLEEKLPVEVMDRPLERMEPIWDNSIVRVHNLYLAHPDESRPPLIDQVSLKIVRGEKVGFLGMTNGDVPVFLRVVSGMLNSDRGLVWIDGKTVNGDQSGTIGWFSERTQLLDGTLRENIAPGGKRHFSDLEMTSAAAITGLDQLDCYRKEGLGALVGESGKELSEEDKIRILLTRSLVHQPDILVFDAPRANSHFATFRRIIEAYLARKNCTLLLGAKHSGHLEITDRTVILEKGKVAQDGPTDKSMLHSKIKS